jgi:small subunit ribosomal protein S21
MAHVTVHARYKEPAERLIKRFSRKVKKEGIIEEVRDRRFYKKPSSVRRQKKLRRKRIIQKLSDQQRNGQK